MLRDVIPIYSFQQFAVCTAMLLFVLWLTQSMPEMTIFGLLYLWLIQFQTRPSKMHASAEEAAWFENVLDAERFYDRSESEGRWHRSGEHWWEHLPHHYIAFEPHSSGVTIIAPRDVLETMRTALEFVEEHEDAFWTRSDRPFGVDAPEPSSLTYEAYLPAIAILALCVLASVWHLFSEGMMSWGLSALALTQGRFETILLHMFAHAGLVHLAMNMMVLVPVGSRLVANLGEPPVSWLRFLALFLLSGLVGAAFFIALHPTGIVPMVGASGAIYGLIGLFVRLPDKSGDIIPIRSAKMRRIGWDLVKQNAFLFALIATMTWYHGIDGGLAWEAHLGGFLFGLLIGPKFLPHSTLTSDSAEPISIESRHEVAETA